jgi:glycosyltransferase involved in cell wall biosynthesis
MQFIPLKLKIGIGNPVREVGALLSLRAAIRSCNPDIVHLISLKNVLLGGLLMRGRKGTPTLCAITGLGTMFLEDRLPYSFLRPLVIQGLKLVFRNPRSVMAVENHDDRKFFIDQGVVSAERSFMVPGAGLEVNAILPTQGRPNIPTILCVSRIIRSKGILELIEAGRILRHEGLRFELLLVGDVDENNPTSLTREELRAAIADGSVKWLGYRSDIPAMLQNATVVCLPSHREGLPRSLVEASAAGRAIVTCDVPGCREVVLNGVNGLLVAPRDSEALADALRTLISNPKTCERMGIESRRRFEQLFTQTAVFEGFNRCYAALELSLQV